MVKKTRHLILLVTALLVVACNMVNVAFCECRQSLIIGSCACEQVMDGHQVSACTDCGMTHDGGADVAYSHHCRHHEVNSGNWEFPVAQQVGMVLYVPCFVPMVPYDFEVASLVCLRDFSREYSPPESVFSLGEVGGAGYCRPLLI